MHSLVVDEVHLLQNINQEYLLVWRHILLDDCAVLFVEFLDLGSLALFLNLSVLWDVNSPWAKEPVAVTARGSLLGAKETEIADIRCPGGT